MTTTALVIEFLITGIQAAIWILIIIFTIFGFDWLPVGKLKDYGIAIGVLLLPILYPIGIFADNVSDSLFARWTSRIRDEHIQDKSHSAIRLAITMNDEWLASYIDYNRAKLRILRSTALNFLLITMTLPIFTSWRLNSVLSTSTGSIVIFEIVCGVCLTALAIWSWHRVTHTFYEHNKIGYNVLQNRIDTSRPQ